MNDNIDNSEKGSNTNQKRRLVQGKQLKEEKRRKWLTKQQAQQQQSSTSCIGSLEPSRLEWFQENSYFASWISKADVDSLKGAHQSEGTKSNLEALLAPYVNIQDKPNKEQSKSNERERLFIAEGTETIRILIQQSIKARDDGLQPIELKSIFIKPSILFHDPVHLLADVERVCEARRSSKDATTQHPGFHVLVGSETTLSEIAGFPVSRGALACGIIPMDRDEEWLDAFLARRLNGAGNDGSIRLLALDGICDSANLGSMIRCASAFGISAIVVSQDTCDCWYRRSIRVSMGHIFRVPVVRTKDLAGTIRQWSQRYRQLETFAAVIDTDNLLESIQPSHVSPSWCCVMGNEGTGISRSVADACTQRVRINMERDVDSLSVPIACGILLHGLKEREKKT